MNNIGDDLIRYISFNLKFKDILNFSIINLYVYTVLDDIFYKNLAYKTWSHLFWKLAQQRNKVISRPLSKWKLELLRIENFQLFLEKQNITRWTQKDFYNYWKFDYFTRNI